MWLKIKFPNYMTKLKVYLKNIDNIKKRDFA
jgi:hypothetical protein